MSDTTLNQDFDVVVIETTGDISVTTCFKNYSDYIKDKVMIEGESDYTNIIRVDINDYIAYKQAKDKIYGK